MPTIFTRIIDGELPGRFVGATTTAWRSCRSPDPARPHPRGAHRRGRPLDRPEPAAGRPPHGRGAADRRAQQPASRPPESPDHRRPRGSARSIYMWSRSIEMPTFTSTNAVQNRSTRGSRRRRHVAPGSARLPPPGLDGSRRAWSRQAVGEAPRSAVPSPSTEAPRPRTTAFDRRLAGRRVTSRQSCERRAHGVDAVSGRLAVSGLDVSSTYRRSRSGEERHPGR